MVTPIQGKRASFGRVCRRLAATAIVLFAGLGLATGSGAGELPQPEGPVILTVSGSISQTNAPGAARFDVQMLQDLGVTGFETSTIWTEGVSVYEGVLLSTLLAHVGAEGTTLHAVALNDYTVFFPLSEAHDDGPILAFRRDGAAMPVRDKGPLWLIYPYDDNPAYRSERIYTRSVWQLDRLRVDP